eukprot:1012305-Prymnesium_polylepis.1
MVRLCTFKRVVCVTYNTPKRYCPPWVVKCDIVTRADPRGPTRTRADPRGPARTRARCCILLCPGPLAGP